MDSTRARLVLREARRRFGVPPVPPAPKASARRLRFLDELFGKQRAFIDDPSREKAALCTRRAGKTTLVSSYLLKVAIERNALCIFIAITRQRAKELIWDELKRLNERYALGAEPNETELSLRFPQGGVVRLIGADKPKEVEKRRGDKPALVVVDEAQLFTSYLQTMVEDVFGPGLMDLRGTLCLMGTPGALRVGYWYETTRNEDDASRAFRRHGFSVHEWSVLDNPHMPHAADEIAALKLKKGWDDNHPTFVREWRGVWADDVTALFYEFDEARNTYEGEPLVRGQRYFGLGWDLGHDDDMALFAWTWSDGDPALYEWRSWKRPGVLLSDVAAVVRQWEEDCEVFGYRVADTGGLGKQLVEEMASREGIRFEPAEKREKAAAVKAMNDDFRVGRILIRRGGEYALELATLMKDPDNHGPNGEPIEAAGLPNHLCDAALYSYRRAQHYLHEPSEEAPPVGSPEALARVEESLEESLEAEYQREQSQEWWEQ